MAIITLYAVHDSKAQMYGRPFPSTNDQTATRGFIQVALDEEGEYYNNPNDYSLFRIGTYDEETTIIKSECPPEHLMTVQTALNEHAKHQLNKEIEKKEMLTSLMKLHQDTAMKLAAETKKFEEQLQQLEQDNKEKQDG